MKTRTTVELDSNLVARAKAALHIDTTRGVIEEALRQATAAAEGTHALQREAQMNFLRGLRDGVDLEILSSDDMWR